MSHPNISQDLIWEITRTTASTLVNRKTGGGARFSRDPLNLTNIHSKKYAGYANDQAFGLSAGKDGGVSISSKKNGQSHKPATSSQNATYGKNTSSRKTYSRIVNSTTKRGYRPDLRQAAVARASAIKKSQKPAKADRPTKLRGAKARKAEEAA